MTMKNSQSTGGDLPEQPVAVATGRTVKLFYGSFPTGAQMTACGELGNTGCVEKVWKSSDGVSVTANVYATDLIEAIPLLHARAKELRSHFFGSNPVT